MTAQVVVPGLDQAEGEARVDRHHVDAELVEALVHQAREVGRGPVMGIGHRVAPPRRHRRPPVEDLGRGAVGLEHGGVERAADLLGVAVGHRGAAALLEVAHDLVVHERHELQEVAVAVEDRVSDPSADLGRGDALFARRHRSPPGAGPTLGRGLGVPRTLLASCN